MVAILTSLEGEILQDKINNWIEAHPVKIININYQVCVDRFIKTTFSALIHYEMIYEC